MFLTDRKKPKELMYYEILARRSELKTAEQRSLQYLISGFEGERQFDAVFDAVGHDNLYVFKDIWLELDGAAVQFDSLVVTDDRLIVNEIKNYSGSYGYDNGEWKVRGQQISEDPVSQVRRAAGKLIKLSYAAGIKFTVQKSVVFVNPYFIFESSDGKDADMLIMPNRLKQYLRSLGNYHCGRSAKMLAEEIQRRIVDNPWPLPETDPGRLRQGLNCWKCGGYDHSIERYTAVCKTCTYTETAERHLVRAALEYSILFPQERISKRKIYLFIDQIFSCRKVQRILGQYLSIIHNGPQTYYQFENKDLTRILKSGGYRSIYETDDDYIFENYSRRGKLMNSGRRTV